MAKNPKIEITQEMRDRALADLDGSAGGVILNQDDRYHYYFAAKDTANPANVDALQRIGYEVVNRENNSGEEVPNADVADGEHGAIQTRDTVLMRIPNELHELREEKYQEMIAHRTSATQAEFDEQVERADKASKSEGKRVFVFGAGRSQTHS